MKMKDILDEQVGEFIGIDIHMTIYKMVFLGKTIHDNPDGIAAI
jgi:hypothetical protein